MFRQLPRLLRRLRSLLAGISVAITLFSGVAHAQWATQNIPLDPGWNAVYLEVQPEVRDTATVLQGLPVDSVWMWNGRFSTVQYIEDPETLVPENPDWLVYTPPGDPRSVATNLHAVQGGRGYLIKLDGNTPVTWTVTGRPVQRKLDWLADSLNLAGFPVDENAPPTFGQLFAPSPAHASLEVFGLTSAGNWAALPNAASTPVVRGRAYFIYSTTPSNYGGPIAVKFDHGATIDFGRNLVERSITLKNESAIAQAVTVAPQGSAPAAGGDTVVAGGVPLSYWEFDPQIAGGVWNPLNGPLTLLLGPGEAKDLRVAVRRPDFTAFSPPPGKKAAYQDILAVSAGQMRIELPVLAKGQPLPELGQGGGGGAGTNTAPFAGLWVGTAELNRVNFVSSANDPNTPLATASSFQLRVIVHVDEQGNANLLDEVTQMWQEPTFKPSVEDPNVQVVDQPGRFVLVTNDAILDQFSGSSLRDGRLSGRRISSTSFTMDAPVGQQGGSFGEALDFSVVLPYDHPVNPFAHRYHPDHDNKDARFEQKRPEGRESFTVWRDVSLEFTALDPEGLALAGYGDTHVGGIYREALTGIHKNVVRTEGVFRLHRVSRVGILNDGISQ